ncbi:MAG: transcription elongation factor GreA [Patescibacteria group bacterium]|nr:transcription elongation factor GreA [Patescibacteria group bacterium]
MDSIKEYLSQEKYDELTEELKQLKSVRRREVAERLAFAKSLGDLSENAEYHAARDEQAEIEDRISLLENMLKSSEIIAGHHSTKVELGSTVTVRRAGSSDSQTYMIVGSEETDVVAGKISHQAPLGAALLGKRRQEQVEVNTPKGSATYEIIKIS